MLSTFTLFTLANAWGSRGIPNRGRPNTSYLSRFPTTPTVTVQAGASVSSALSQCNVLVGSGYCTIRLAGNPSDSPISLSRSKTKLTAASGVVVTSSGPGAFVEISGGVKEVVVDGLDLKGHRSFEVFGVIVSGKAKKVAVLNCKIHDFDGDNAHGIAVYGGGPSVIVHVLIRGNQIYDMRLGSSEAIVVNGFVRKWAITDNHVYDVNNIAIDAIGGEGTYPPSTTGGRVLPSARDSAYSGFIEDNLVERMSTSTNPAYGSRRSWAAGIYIDGANRVLIQRNTVIDTPWAYEIGAENCLITRDIIMRDNTARGSYYGDLVLGGYARKGYLLFPGINCNPLVSSDSSEGHGYVQKITVEDNNFETTDGTEDNILPQFRVTNAIIRQPGVEPVNENGDGSATGDGNAIRTT